MAPTNTHTKRANAVKVRADNYATAARRERPLGVVERNLLAAVGRLIGKDVTASERVK